MARINLLPWRAERRRQRQKEFMAMVGASALGAVVVSFLIYMFYNAQIDGQTERNTYLRDQITQVDAKIKEIEALDQKKSKLLARKEVIEQLQANRKGITETRSNRQRNTAKAEQVARTREAQRFATPVRGCNGIRIIGDRRREARRSRRDEHIDAGEREASRLRQRNEARTHRQELGRHEIETRRYAHADDRIHL